MEAFLKKIVTEKGFAMGLGWEPKSDKSALEVTGSYLSDPKMESYKTKSSEFNFVTGKGIPGRVWQNKNYEFKDNIQTFTVEQYPRVNVAKECNVKGCYGFAVLKDDGELGFVAEFFLFEEAKEDSSIVEYIKAEAAKVFK